ncbi:MAG TPA: EsaB/YukD family protein [Symbiobacteriaceae bacterium]|nr:EsaB/YukD family protein [Symbiobacteriaceae bacterium]
MSQLGPAGQKVVVSISRADEGQVYDVELPVDVPLGSLAAVAAMALGWSEDEQGRTVAFEVKVHQDGRTLSAHDSLAQAGVWDGSWLVFHPRPGLVVQRPAPAAEPPTAPVPLAPVQAPSPIIRWRPLTQAVRGDSGKGGAL